MIDRLSPQGVGIANVVSNREQVVGWGEEKKLRSVITYDDGELSTGQSYVLS